MVKLLRLYTDYGEEKLLKAIDNLKGSEITVEQIQAHLIPVNPPVKMPIGLDIKVSKPQFNKYDALLAGGTAV